MTEDIDLIRVTGVEYVKDYTMRLEFSNGKVKLVNFLPLLKGKLFEPLKDLRNVVQFANHLGLVLHLVPHHVQGAFQRRVEVGQLEFGLIHPREILQVLDDLGDPAQALLRLDEQ